MSCCCSCRSKNGKVEIKIVQGDDYDDYYQILASDGVQMTEEEIDNVYFTVGRIGLTIPLEFDKYTYSWKLHIAKEVLENVKRMSTTYDITVYYKTGEKRTVIYDNPFFILEKHNRVEVVNT